MYRIDPSIHLPQKLQVTDIQKDLEQLFLVRASLDVGPLRNRIQLEEKNMTNGLTQPRPGFLHLDLPLCTSPL
jgi:hypothetical protein